MGDEGTVVRLIWMNDNFHLYITAFNNYHAQSNLPSS